MKKTWRLGSLLAIMLVAGEGALAGTLSYRVTTIDVPGQNRTWSPSAIDNNGRVVGTTQLITPVPNSTPLYGNVESFVWHPTAGVILLPSPSGATGVYAQDIADSGHVVGSYTISQSDGRSVERAFSWQPGSSLVTLDDGGSGRASKVNNRGQIVGGRLVGSFSKAVVWEGASTTILGGLDSSDPPSVATSINDAGVVVGNLGSQSVKWVNGVATLLLGVDGTQYTQPVDINDSGQIIGFSELGPLPSGFMAYGPVSWAPNAIESTLMFPRLGAFAVNGVNEAGQAIGYDSDASTDLEFFGPHDPFVWSENSGVIWLDDQIDPSDPLAPFVRLNTVTDINDRGQIIGTAMVAGVSRGILLTPVPEPTSLVLLGAGAGVLLISKRYRKSTVVASAAPYQ